MKKIMILTLCAALVGCQGMNNQDVGTISGGVIGGLLGSRFGGGSGRAAAIAGGVLVGTVIGSKIGQTMDRQDRLEMTRALESTKTGRRHEWTNPDSGNHYTVRPTKTYTRPHKRHAQPCREYVQTAMIGGKEEKVYGRACRMNDGSWEIVNNHR